MKEPCHWCGEVHSSKIVQANKIDTKAVRPTYSVLDNTKSKELLSNRNFWEKSVDEVIKSIINN